MALEGEKPLTQLAAHYDVHANQITSSWIRSFWPPYFRYASHRIDSTTIAARLKDASQVWRRSAGRRMADIMPGTVHNDAANHPTDPASGAAPKLI
jgi:hypothetical protein